MNKVKQHMDICLGLNKLYERKNHDYGDSFHDTFVEEGMAMARIRLSDKLNRFKKLSRAEGEQKVNDESIRDTLLDLANYAIMTVMEMDIQEELKQLSDDYDQVLEKMRAKEKEDPLDGLIHAIGIPSLELNGPCKECTYPGKSPNCVCMIKAEWDRSQKEGTTDASETEQADG